MSFPRYPKYRDSGVEWLGEVPEHWAVQRLKPILHEVDERIGDRDALLLGLSKTAGVLPRAEIAQNASESDDYSKYKECHVGDLVMNKMQAWNGVFGLSAHTGIVSPDYAVFRFHDQRFAAFLTHAFRTDLAAGEFFCRCRGMGTAFLRLNTGDFLDTKIALPPASEVHHITTFLDRETAKIDALIAEQQRLVELLQEKRQAVISHAVTKGLNPDVPMKDSGIEWLGEVPEHWKTSRLKHASAKIVDCPHETPTYCEDGEYLVIRTPDLNDGCLLTEGMTRVDHTEYTDRTRREKLRTGDIVYSREGGRWGHAATVPEDERFCLGQRMMQFRASEDWDAGYLMWHLTSRHVYAQGEVDTAGAASPHVNVGTISNYRLARPPLDEQSHIARVLGSLAAGCDDLMNQAQNAIALLQERRSALISAAVTGQIDVRGLAGSEAA